MDIHEKNFIESFLAHSETGSEMGIPGVLESTPPLKPVNALSGAGFARMPRKILSPKGLGVKILISKNLSVGHPDCTASSLLRQ